MKTIQFKSNNNDDGTCFVGQVEGLPPVDKSGLRVDDGSVLLQLAGDSAPRRVTYIMGSATKGFHLACRGQGRFTKGEIEGTITLVNES